MIRRMAHPKFDFYIHVDRKKDITAYLFLAKIPNVYLIKDRVNVIWAGYNTVEATLRSVKEIFRTGKHYNYIHLMSGQDYPIKSAGYIYDFFVANNGKEFLQFEHFDEWASESYPRIRTYHLINYRFPGKYRFQWLMNKFLPARKSPLGIEFYGSSMFWAITSNCLKHIIEVIEKNARFKRFMRFTWGSDEFIFQTLVMIVQHFIFRKVKDLFRVHRFLITSFSQHFRFLYPMPGIPIGERHKFYLMAKLRVEGRSATCINFPFIGMGEDHHDA